MNFYIQTESTEQFVRSSWRAEIERAKKFGAILKNCTLNSCDVIFPDKESMDAFVGGKGKELSETKHKNIVIDNNGEKMISIEEYAKSVDQKEDFEEYLRCFTGYDTKSAKRSLEECENIYKDFQEKYKEKMTYDDFADAYFWEFTRLCQLSKITNQECNLNERLLRVAVRKRVNDSDLKTFSEWKAFYNSEKENCEEWESNDSVDLFEKEIWPQFSANGGKFEMTKLELANIVEKAYQQGRAAKLLARHTKH